MDQIAPTDMKDKSTRSAGQSIPLPHPNPGQTQMSSNDGALWAFAGVNEWTPSLSTSTSDPMALDVDLLLEQENYTNDASIPPIDWNEWDTLLRDWDGSFAGQ